MTKIKICGLKDSENLAAAIDAGADFIGLVFHAPSPRNITPESAAILADKIPARIKMTGLFVNADDSVIETTLKTTRLDLLQLHGSESPERVAAIRKKFDLPVMKAIAVASANDLEMVPRYEAVTDWLLFDAKSDDASMPGGTGRAFDWSLLGGRRFAKPWMLSGGLTPQNVKQALAALKPDGVDVSSGVESVRGVKSAEKIRAFIAAVKN